MIHELYGEGMSRGQIQTELMKHGIVLSLDQIRHRLDSLNAGDYVSIPLDHDEVIEKDLKDFKDKTIINQQRSSYRKVLRDRSRSDIIAEVLASSVKSLPAPLVKDIPAKFEYGEEAVLVISDMQIGQLTIAEEVGGLSEYSLEILENRMDNLIVQLKSILDNHAKMGKPIKKLHIILGGDIVDGETIFPGQSFEIETNVVDQMFSAVQEISKLLLEVAKIVPDIEVPCVYGNHGRIGKKGENKNHVNFDYLSYKFLETQFKQFKNIKFIIPKTWWLVHQVAGHNFLIMHGDTLGGSSNSLESQNAQLALLMNSVNIRADYLILGHHHRPLNFDTPVGEVIVNGNWAGGSLFSLHRLATSNKPSQMFFSMDREYGISYRYKILLDKC